jgi:lipopolysaccharide heptosyltransferase II
MTTHAAWEHAENVLCVRLDSLGDVLMTTPAIRALRRSRPGRRITLLTSPAGAEAARLVPEIDHVIVYDAPWLKATTLRSDSHAEYAIADRLRSGHYDAAVIFTVYSQNPLPSAFLCYLADIPLRLAHCHENPYQLLTDWVPDREPVDGIRHEVQRQLDLVTAVGCVTTDTSLSLRVPPEADRRVAALLSELGISPGRPWMVIHPGASAPSRRYSIECYGQVARRLTVDGFRVVFTGSTDERGLIERAQMAMDVPSHSLAGCLDLGGLAALIARAPLLITNNTGPAHVAAAVSTPVVVLYALTNPQHTPWNVPARVLFHDVPCRLCYKSVCPFGHGNCLRLITPEQVVRASYDLLDETGAPLPLQEAAV